MKSPFKYSINIWQPSNHHKILLVCVLHNCDRSLLSSYCLNVQAQPVSYCVTNIDMASDREWHERRFCELLIDANVYGMRTCLYDSHQIVGLCHEDGCHTPINWGQPMSLFTVLSCLLSTVMCHLLSQTVFILTKVYKLT